jgi:simple sugar transport system substrate-binding protein
MGFQKSSTTNIIVFLIIGLVIGAGIGWLAKPAPPTEGVSEEVYNAVLDERDDLKIEVDNLKVEVEDLKAEVEDLQNQVISLTEGNKLKAAFIYVGPIGDYGWSHAHDQGRLYVESKFPWLETAYSESVAEGDAFRFIERYIQEGYGVVFTTSFGFMDDTVEAAEKYSDKILWHCSGYLRRENLGTYFSEFHQLYYLNGLMAGALTKTNKVGYVGAYPIPEVVRHINAFALGVKEANPDATVSVKWIYAWYDPSSATQATEALIAEGVDAIAFTEDSPAVVQVGQKHTDEGEQIYTFGHYSPMQDFGPDTVVSGQLVNWGVIYEDILAKIYSGAYDNTNLEDVDYWWMLKHGAAELGGKFGVPINTVFVDELNSTFIEDDLLGEVSVYTLIMKRLDQMKEETVLFDPFVGPIYDNEGNLRIEEGRRGTHDELWTIDWYVDNILGKVP